MKQAKLFSGIIPFAIMALAAFLLSCSDGGDYSGGGGTGTTTVTAVTVSQAAPTTSHPTSATPIANGVDYYEITVTVTGTVSRQALSGQNVSFATDGQEGGTVTLTPAAAVTDANGQATCRVRYLAAGDETITIVASAGDESVEYGLAFLGRVNAISLEVTAPLGSLVIADGTQAYTVRALATDVNNAPVAGVSVGFGLPSRGQATLSTASAVTGADGTASCEVSDLSTVNETVNVKATVGGKSSNTLVLAFLGNLVGRITLAAPAVAGKTANGTDAYAVIALAESGDGRPMSGVEIIFTKSGNTGQVAFSPSDRVTTGASGTAQVNVTDINSNDDTVAVNASGRGVAALSPVSLEFIGTASGTGSTNVLAITPDSAVDADGATQATVVVRLTDADGAVLQGQAVTLAASGSAVIAPPNPATTNASGQAVFQLTNTVGETVTLTASGGGAPNVSAYQVFNPIVASVAVQSVAPASGSAPASGLDTIQITFLVSNTGGNPVTGQTVGFSAVGHGGGSPVVTPASAVTNASGLVSVTVADTTAETVSVSAAASGVQGSQQVSFTALAPANMVLNSTSPSPPIISITGGGSQESATLTFKVVDVNNNPVQGSHVVDFSILSGGLNGGESLTITQSSTSDALVSTVLNSGTKAGTLQVRAALNANPSIYTDVTVTITGGLPHGNAFSLSISPLNLLLGLVREGETQSVTARAADFYSNPVAPNVQAQFQTDYAHIDGQGVFGTARDSSATVELTTGEPYPRTDGLVTIQAQTVGGLHSRVLSLAVDPVDKDIIYAGTDGGGVFKTVDGGLSWELAGRPLIESGVQKVRSLLGTMVYQLVIDPNHTSVLYAATNKGVYVSTNGGQHWKPITGLRVVIDPLGVATGAAYAANGKGEHFAFNANSSMVRSRMLVFVDGVEVDNYLLDGDGITFFGAPGASLTPGDQVTAEYDVLTNFGATEEVRSIAVDHSTYDANDGYAQTIFAGTYGAGLFRTLDGGDNWAKKVEVATVGVNFGPKVLSLAFNAPSELLAGTEESGLFKTATADTICQWTKVTGVYDMVQDIAFSTSGGVMADIWVGGKDGVHWYDNLAGAWKEPTTDVNASDPLNTDVRAIVRDDNDGALYAATYGDVLDASEPHGGVYKSVDNGDNWTRLADVFTPSRATGNGAHFMDALAIFPALGDDVLVVGSKGRSVSLSDDSGASWTAINGQAPTNLTNTLFATLKTLHSGYTQLSVVPIQATYQPTDAYDDGTANDYLSLGSGYGAFGTIYHNETHAFYVRVADSLGNRLPAGTTFDAAIELTGLSTEGGTLGGTTTQEIVDGTYYFTDYYVYWTNNITSSADQTAELVLTVASEAGNETVRLGRTLKGALSADDIEVTLAYDANGAVNKVIQPTGGSYTGYVFNHAGLIGGASTNPDGNAAPQYFCTYNYNYPANTYNAGDVISDAVTVTDWATGEAKVVSVTITFE